MEQKQLSLVKGPHRYIFRYDTGAEPQIISSFADLADDKESGFDWFDAAVLSYQMGKQLDQDVERLSSSPPRE
jgi:hypothetical protein